MLLWMARRVSKETNKNDAGGAFAARAGGCE
jgi:hypothetical protein